MKRLMLYRGDTPTLNFQVYDESGQPMNLLDWQLFFSFKIGSHHVKKECDIYDPLAGKAQVTLSSEDTKEAGYTVCELEGRKEGVVYTFGQVLLCILEDVKDEF